MASVLVGPKYLHGEDPTHVRETESRSSKFFSRQNLPIVSDAAPEMSAPTSGARSPYFATSSLKALAKENVELRQRLQRMELDRLRAVSNIVPREEAYALRSSIWHSPVIEVSWENPEAAPDAEREWVRDAVKQTWEKHSALRFINWGKSQPDSKGIRIRIEDSGPHCKRLGSKLDGLPDGMVLNFTFQNWCPTCAGLQGAHREYSIRAIAVHEFGHAIGFAHEQNREDAPAWCQEMWQGSPGDWYVTIYDPESIMNYCSTEWNNQGKLSPLDIEAIQIIYGSNSQSATEPSANPTLTVERPESHE